MSKVNIPAFLLYPEDPIADLMFGKSMVEIRNEKCGYRFMLYREIADPVPEIEEMNPPFAVHEAHFYWKEDSPSWYSVSTMKDVSVPKSPLESWVEKADAFALRFGAADHVLRMPKAMRGRSYRKVALVDMEEWPDFNRIHGFDESHVYAHVFYLEEQLYKKFILVARKGDVSWRVEVNIPSEHEQIMPYDFVPAGQTFGAFYPLKND